MTAHRAVFLTCDDCGNSIGMAHMWRDTNAARRGASDHGWTAPTNEQGHTRDFCEDCSGGLSP